MTAAAAVPVAPKPVANSAPAGVERSSSSSSHAVVEEKEKPKLDAFDAKHAGAPSPDYSGMLSSDDDSDDATQMVSPGIDPASGEPLPPMPAAFLSPRKA
jgi:hypothetical protein